MWYNKQVDKYIYVGKNYKWIIGSSQDYNSNYDSVPAWAGADFYDSNGIKRCPQDIDYKLWVTYKFVSGTDLSVTSA